MSGQNYIPLKDLEVYRLAFELSKLGWQVYINFDWQTKKTMGDQFIESTDSVGANIAEGYHRFHYLDKIKFYYNARASLAECGIHWIELLYQREKISIESYTKFRTITRDLSVKLNNFISATYKSKAA